MNGAIIIVYPVSCDIYLVYQAFFTVIGIVVMVSSTVVMFGSVLIVIIEKADNCCKSFVMMMMWYNGMSQYNHIGKQYKKYRYCFSHLNFNESKGFRLQK